jgi:hypothetical protein
MTLDQLRALLAQIQSDPSAVTDDQIRGAVAAIRERRDAARGQDLTPEVVAELEALVEVRQAVVGLRDERVAAAAEQAERADQGRRLLDDLDIPDEPQPPAAADSAPAAADTAADTAGDGGGSDGNAQATPAEQGVQVREETPALAELMAGLTAAAQAMTVSAQAMLAAARTGSPTADAAADTDRPQGRRGRAGQTAPAAAPAPTGDTVRYTVRANGSVGTHQHGDTLTSLTDVGRAVADRLRSAATRGGNGEKLYVANVVGEYTDRRTLRPDDLDGNAAKIEAVTSDTALVAAGGLCAPLTPLYDVDVIGSTARPVRDALARFNVERGGIQYRPHSSAAEAVYGAGVWTVADDSADPLGTKGCYVVDCPGVQQAVIEAIYLCLEFSNITSRFDPETTAANVREGMIAHARLAETQLLAAMATASKILSGSQVIGAVRDILVNLDKTTAYYRNRHRIEDRVALTWIAPGWVKSLMRADLARQMAAGDWTQALAPADALIDSWFSRRGVTPVWHLDGPGGTNEVQTVTITGAPTGGTFTLTFDGQTTANIAYNATAAAVQSALEALSNINPSDIAVAGGPGPATPWTVTFAVGDDGGQFDGRNVPQMTATGSFTGGTSPAVAVTTTTGGGGALSVSGVSIASQTYGPTAAGEAIPGFPDQIDSLLFSSGSWLFLDGGNLDLGLVRDSTLNSRNRYRQFTETFEGVANRGVEPLRLVMSVQPTGTTAGTEDLSAIAD